jgi:beta-glucosidase/6-phospho-beta-glucosidase/beta-galactosidase
MADGWVAPRFLSLCLTLLSLPLLASAAERQDVHPDPSTAGHIEPADEGFPLPYLFNYPDTYQQEGAFPPGFVWGAATASYQIEGGWDADGKGPSIWDVFTGTDDAPINPGMDAGRGQSGMIACDSYHRVKDDVALLKRLGLTAYRFSISWPRLLPNGTLAASGGVVNPAGIEYYNTLIDELLSVGIEPFVTLYHWDLPQALLHDPASAHPSPAGWQGWLDDRLPAAFAEFADVCFAVFGDRVKKWFTLNEPFTFAVGGHSGPHAPSLCNWDEANGCHGGLKPPAGWEVYRAAHNALLAHGLAVRLYRSTYAVEQRGHIGIVLSGYWYEPASHKRADVAAAARAMDFELGWFLAPIVHGQYPAAMRTKLGARLPSFSPEEAAMLVGSYDHLGLNHYSSMLVRENRTAENYGQPGGEPVSHARDCDCAAFPPHGAVQSNATWLSATPWGMRKALAWVNSRYSPRAIYVTENGWAEGSRTFREAAHDPRRIRYLANYTSELLRAMNEEGVPVLGYFAWSLLDNFEWEQGFHQRFGLVFVDFNSPRRERYAKTSVCWYRELARTNALVPPEPFADGVSEHKAARRPSLDQILAGWHSLPQWMRVRARSDARV